MSKKSQPTPPPPLDPRIAINAQADANRINQYTPYGNLTFTNAGQPLPTSSAPPSTRGGIAGLIDQAVAAQNGGQTFAPGGNASATLTLDPAIQRLLDLQIGTDTGLLQLGQQALGSGGIADLIGNPLSTEGLPQIGDSTQTRNEAERAFFQRSRGLLDEQFQTEEERLRQRLANQGFQSGNEGFGQELGVFNQRRNDAFGNLANDAVLFGGQESSRMMSDQGRLRQMLFGEQGATRANQFNELASLLGLQQVQQPGLNNFFGPGQVDALGAYGLQQQGRMNNFNTQSQAAGQAKGSTAELAGTVAAAAMMFSDRRLKTNIHPTVKVNGIQWYEWDWNETANEIGLFGHSRGVIADEVPHAAVNIDGWWHVDYGAL